MNKKTIITTLLALVAMVGQAQEKREYNISGFVPDGTEKVYLYKTEGLGSRVFLDSAIVADGKFTMKGNRPAYDLVSVGNKGLHSITFFVDGEPMTVDFANDTLIASTLNEKFQGYMAEDKVFTDNFYRLFMASKKAASETEKHEIEQQIAANNEAMIEQARHVIRENRDNVIAAYFLQAASGYMDYEELSAVIDSTAYYFNHPLMNEARQRLQAILHWQTPTGRATNLANGADRASTCSLTSGPVGVVPAEWKCLMSSKTLSVSATVASRYWPFPSMTRRMLGFVVSKTSAPRSSNSRI